MQKENWEKLLYEVSPNRGVLFFTALCKFQFIEAASRRRQCVHRAHLIVTAYARYRYIFKFQFIELFQIMCHCEPVRTLVWQSPAKMRLFDGDCHVGLRPPRNDVVVTIDLPNSAITGI